VINRIGFAFAACVLSGCLLDLRVPDGTSVSCVANTDCPNNWACSPTGLCVDPARLQEGSPALVAVPRVSPEVGAQSAVFVLTFEVSKPLTRDPVVEVDTGVSQGLFWVDDERTQREALKYTYLFSLSDRPDGETLAATSGSHPITIALTDAVGSSVRGLSAGSLRYDLDTPPLIDVAFSKPSFSIGETVLLSLTVGEVLADEAPTIFAFDTDPSLTLAFSVGLTYVYSRVVDASFAEGTYTLSAMRLADAVGNQTIETLAAPRSFSVDSHAPVITPCASISTTPLRIGQSVTLQVLSSEALATAPSARIGDAIMQPAAATCVAPSGSQAWGFTYDALGGEIEGSQAIIVEARDAAGNETRSVAGTVRFDFTAPAIVSGTTALQLQPGAGNPLPSVTAATNGTTISVSFALSEALSTSACAAVPVVEVASTQQALSLLATNGPLYSFGGTLTGLATTTEQLRLRPSVSLCDDAGNIMPAATIASFDVDTTPPPVAQTAPDQHVIFTRVPWGNEATEGKRSFCLSGVSGSVAPSSSVIVYDRADVAAAAELGRTVAGDDGSFGVEPCSDAAFQLSLLDVRHVYVAAVDAAGNVSDADPVLAGVQASPVVDTIWSATMGDKVVGDILTNPHELERNAAFAFRASESFQTSTDGSATTRVDAAVETVTHAGTEWIAIPRTLAGQPAPGPSTAVAYDSHRQRTVHYGGSTLLEWDGTRWWTITPTDPEIDGDPVPRSYAAMAYDSARRRTVLFGGTIGNGSCEGAFESECGATWEWDGVSWRRMKLIGAGPSARHGMAMAYDEVRGKIVLFGGQDSQLINCLPRSQNACGDTWEYDGRRWNKITPIDPEGDGNPRARAAMQMTWDPSSQRVVMFGGYTSNNAPVTCDGSGSQNCGGPWAWNGKSWSLLVSTAPEPDGRPAARNQAGVAFDAVRSRLVVFGGTQGNWFNPVTPFDSFVWEWSGTAWARVTPVNLGDGVPASRAQEGLVYDAARSEILLLGASSGGPSSTWRYKGAGFDRINNGSDDNGDGSPSARMPFNMVYDTQRERSIIIGGLASGAACDGGATERCGNRVWSWNGYDWTVQIPTDPEGDGNPTPRSLQAMAYDIDRDRVVLFGGEASSNCDGGASSLCGEVWEWDNQSFKKVTPTPGPNGVPMARKGAAMVYDEALHETLLFGGDATVPCDDGTDHFCSVLWAWNGVSWRRISTLDPENDGNPQGRSGFNMAYDYVRHEVVIYGGEVDYDALCDDGSLNASATYYNQAWAFNGVSWQRRGTQMPGLDPSVPGARKDAALAYDASVDAVVMIGGYEDYSSLYLCNDSGFYHCGDRWLLRGNTWTRADVQGSEALSPRAGAGLSYDRARGRSVLFGGFGYDFAATPTNCDDGDEFCDRVWESRAVPGAAVQFRARLGSELGNQTRVQALSASFVAGARGSFGEGASLLAWDGESFTRVAQNAATTTTPAALAWTSRDPSTLDRFFSPVQALMLVVRGSEASGGTAQVSVDYAEVSVRYRRVLRTCGNGTLDASEQCETAVEIATCNEDCTASACGDGVLNAAAGEQCDDGSFATGDGCDADCLLE
jgi:cysteine-rich repeat protein